jgi:hypothetical protein
MIAAVGRVRTTDNDAGILSSEQLNASLHPVVI